MDLNIHECERALGIVIDEDPSDNDASMVGFRRANHHRSRPWYSRFRLFVPEGFLIAEKGHQMMTKLSDLLTKLLEKLESWLDELVVMLPNLILAVGVVVLGWFVAQWVRRGMYRLIQRITRNEPISGLLSTVARITVISISVLFALGLLNLDKTVTSLLAGVGVVGLALGFAFQDIAANFMSGFMMALNHPFSVGDLVEVANRKGKVKAIELRATELETLDGLSVLIPNREIFQNPIVNYTRTGPRRLDLTVGVAYSDDLELARRLAIEAGQQLSARAKDREVRVVYNEFGDSSINFSLQVWLHRSDQATLLEARSEAIIAIKRTFDAHGITIPFPIRTLDFGASAVGGTPFDALAYPSPHNETSQPVSSSPA